MSGSCAKTRPGWSAVGRGRVLGAGDLRGLASAIDGRDGAGEPVGRRDLGVRQDRGAVLDAREPQALDRGPVAQEGAAGGRVGRAERPLGEGRLDEAELAPDAVRPDELDQEDRVVGASEERLLADLATDGPRDRRRSEEVDLGDEGGKGDLARVGSVVPRVEVRVRDAVRGAVEETRVEKADGDAALGAQQAGGLAPSHQEALGDLERGPVKERAGLVRERDLGATGLGERVGTRARNVPCTHRGSRDLFLTVRRRRREAGRSHRSAPQRSRRGSLTRNQPLTRRSRRPVTGPWPVEPRARRSTMLIIGSAGSVQVGR